MRRHRTPLAFVATFSLFVAGITAGNQTTLAAYAAGGDPYLGLDVFSRAMTQIQRNHVEEMPTRELVWAAIEGMSEALDRHSMFFDPDTYSRILEDHEGRYYGVGVESRPAEDGGIRIVDVLPGSPAEMAGVLVEDRIIAVDGEDITELSFDEATARIKGPRGQFVSFGIERAGQGLTLEVARDEIVTPAATGGWLADGIGYVRVEQFRVGVTQQMSDAIDDLSAEGPIDGLVIDLRDNPGGLLTEAADMVDRFVSSEEVVVTTRGRIDEELEELRASDTADDLEMPLVVLVDGDSASGSEIVAGALQELGRATIVGQPTWGKGSVQRIYEYSDGSALKLTVARYYLPSGKAIDVDGGVVPDIEASLVLPADALIDPAEVLRERLEETVSDETERAELLALVDQLEGPTSRVVKPSFRGDVQGRLAKDGQLQAALTVLRDAQ